VQGLRPSLGGEAMKRGTDPMQFFDQQVDRSGGPTACHPWTSWRAGDGYGDMFVDGKHVRVHRWLMEQLTGRKLDRREEVLHCCDNPPCVNPAHLRIGTHTENMRDAVERGRLRIPRAAAFAARTHCPSGHEFTAENTRIREGKHGRRCRACDRLAQQVKRQLARVRAS